MTGKKGLILDRDGTLIDVVRDEETGTVNTAFHPRQLRLLPGVVEGIRAARAAGYAIGVATNQPGAAKGQFSFDAITRTNEALLAMLDARGATIDALEICIHHPEGGPGGDPSLVAACDCRKPLPGMLHKLVARLGLDASRTWMVGDTPTDMQAGIAAGVHTALVFPVGRCEFCPLRGGPAVTAEVTAPTFDRVIAAILAS